MIWLMRLGGTAICRANSVGVTPNSSSSSFRISPGCTALMNMADLLSLVIVDDFNVARLREIDSPLPSLRAKRGNPAARLGWHSPSEAFHPESPAQVEPL